jgi:Bacterial extracellular solute-binding proteins, family 5 Middle
MRCSFEVIGRNRAIRHRWRANAIDRNPATVLPLVGDRRVARQFMRSTLLAVFAGVVALLGAAGCGPRPAANTTPGGRDCRIVRATPAARSDTVTVALGDPVDPSHAPHATNPSERLVFGQVYETLIAVDCTGAMIPRLASAWSRHDDGRRWTLVLRDGAHFADGTPATARDVAQSWQDPIARGAGVDSVVAVDDRRIDVFVENPALGLAPLAAPSLAVTKRAADSPWPLGTGPYRVTADSHALIVRPVRGHAPVVRFVDMRARDPRDVIDRGLDAMVTGDADLIDYARSRNFVVTALAYDRLYVVISTARVDTSLRGAMPPSVADHIARNAIRSPGARGPELPCWWSNVEGCGDVSPFAAWQIPGPGNQSRRTAQVLYDVGDSTARDIAERVVALATWDDSATADAAAVRNALPDVGAHAGKTRGLTTAEFETRLHDGADAAYIVALPCRPADPCDAARELLLRAPWLALPALRFGDALIPLAETHASLLTRPGRVTATMDYYGGVTITGDDGEHLP